MVSLFNHEDMHGYHHYDKLFHVSSENRRSKDDNDVSHQGMKLVLKQSSVIVWINTRDSHSSRAANRFRSRVPDQKLINSCLQPLCCTMLCCVVRFVDAILPYASHMSMLDRVINSCFRV